MTESSCKPPMASLPMNCRISSQSSASSSSSMEASGKTSMRANLAGDRIRVSLKVLFRSRIMRQPTSVSGWKPLMKRRRSPLQRPSCGASADTMIRTPLSQRDSRLSVLRWLGAAPWSPGGGSPSPPSPWSAWLWRPLGELALARARVKRRSSTLKAKPNLWARDERRTASWNSPRAGSVMRGCVTARGTCVHPDEHPSALGSQGPLLGFSAEDSLGFALCITSSRDIASCRMPKHSSVLLGATSLMRTTSSPLPIPRCGKSSATRTPFSFCTEPGSASSVRPKGCDRVARRTSTAYLPGTAPTGKGRDAFSRG
mmetsp:Transcript_13453/g.42597  ORF Transcript_13453/g.42597 Transcript_13453/m.42597 type:complete len:314 (-) Transcript_13453:160-1101(-)